MQMTDSARLSSDIDRETSRLLITYLQMGEQRNVSGLDISLASAGLIAGGYQVRDIDQFLRVCYLLSPSTIRFVAHVASELRNLRSSSRRQFNEVAGMIRGGINWAQTVPVQILRPTSYVCANAHRTFDLPENRMLSVLIEEMSSDAELLFRGWGAQPRANSSPMGWRSDLSKLRLDLSLIRRNPHFLLIPKVNKDHHAALARLISRARCRRAPFAHEIISEFELYREITARRIISEKANLRLAEGLRWPERPKLFELFVLFRLGELLRKELGAAELVPIGTKEERWFLRFRTAGVEVTVYYQLKSDDASVCYRPDTEHASINEYVRVLKLYGKDFAELRPDVTIEALHLQSGRRRIVLVEAKHS